MSSADLRPIGANIEAPHLSNGVYRNGVARHTDSTPAQSQAGLKVTKAEYWQFYYQHPDFNYEWNNGILEGKPLAKIRGRNFCVRQGITQPALQ